MIIAHSHGGNVATRALGYLDIDVSNLPVCYLATPFMQLFPRTVGFLERLIIAAAMFFFFLIISVLAVFSLFLFIHFYVFDMTRFGHNNETWLIPIAMFVALFLSIRFYFWMSSAGSQTRNNDLVKATANLRDDQLHGDILILRAIDDEASLAISAGTITNLVSVLSMSILTLLLIVLTVGGAEAARWIPGYKHSYVDLVTVPAIMVFLLFTLMITLLSAVLSRGVYGWELITNAPGIQMNVQGVPDFIHSAEIRTLLRGNRGFFFALRHGIYCHPDASSVVAHWISANTHPANRRKDHADNAPHVSAADEQSSP